MESTPPPESFWVSHPASTSQCPVRRQYRGRDGLSGSGLTHWWSTQHQTELRLCQNLTNSDIALLLDISDLEQAGQPLPLPSHTCPSPSRPLAAWPRRHVTSGATASFYRWGNRGPERQSPKDSHTARLQAQVWRGGLGAEGGGLSMRGHSAPIDWVRRPGYCRVGDDVHCVCGRATGWRGWGTFLPGPHGPLRQVDQRQPQEHGHRVLGNAREDDLVSTIHLPLTMQRRSGPRGRAAWLRLVAPLPEPKISIQLWKSTESWGPRGCSPWGRSGC